jgi:hypothetical protein
MEKAEKEASRAIQTSHFLSFLNRIGGIFLAPDVTFSQIIAERISFLEPFMVVILLVGIEAAVVASFAYRLFAAITASIGSFTGGASLGFLAVIPWIMLTIVIVAALIFWLVVAGIAHVGAKYIFKGNGSFVQLVKLYGYAFIPYSLAILSTILFGISWATWPISMFLNIATTFWIVVLMTTAVRQNYGIDTGKAFISSFIGPMLVWLLIIGLLWAWMWIAINTIAGGFI